MKKYLKLIASFTAVFLVVIYISPLAENLPFVKAAVKVIDENEIDATALYYTEIKEFSRAELNIINSIEYAPVDSAEFFEKISSNSVSD